MSKKYPIKFFWSHHAVQLCTTAFFVEVAQYIKFGDLNSVEEEQPTTTDTEGPHTLFQSETNGVVEIPQLYIDIPDGYDSGQEPKLTKKEEDVLLKESTADFADWITSFIRRVILLLENLPDEGTEGSNVGGETEGMASNYQSLPSLTRFSPSC